MLPKAHLTLHYRMSGSRWVITPSWLSGLCRSLLFSSSVYSCHLFLISSPYVRCILFSVLYCAYFCMKCSLGVSNFLEVISSLSHSIVFLFAFLTSFHCSLRNNEHFIGLLLYNRLLQNSISLNNKYLLLFISLKVSYLGIS